MWNFLTKKGNVWSTLGDERCLLLITTNSVVKKNGELVMGAGIAKEATQRFPGIQKIFGDEILANAKQFERYGLIVGPSKKLGAFQTKINWRDNSLLGVIEYSTKMLANWLEDNPGYSAQLPLPGCGNGGLDPEEVYPILNQFLDERVTVWTKN